MHALTIVVVDDDPDMRLYLQGCLQGLGGDGSRVIEAADGQEALRLVRKTDVDLVISDVVLPRLDGRSLLAAIRADPGLRHIPVLLVSGQEQATPPESPADAWLSKPFNARQLLGSVRRLLGELPST